ncbi:MAG TPA: YceI family protein [Cytophagales bacterium]|nr:YceI family protein [Cytophagales bacterium]
MKIKILAFATLIALAFSACKDNNTTETKGSDTTKVTVDTAKKEETYKVDVDSSNVTWHGEVVGGAYFHDGSVKITEGTLGLNGEAISSGNFTVDLRSIKPTDKNYSGKDKTPENLVKHLTTADFFATDSFPSATFVVKSAQGNTLIGDLTVRGRTNEEKVTDVVITKTADAVKATGKLVFNRQKYGVSYKSNLKDVVLADDITLNISLKATK